MNTLNLDNERWDLVSDTEEKTATFELEHLELARLYLQLASECAQANELTTKQLLEEF